MSARAATAAVSLLRSPRTIRARCRRVLEAGLAGELAHFRVDLGRLDEAARFTADVTRRRYPDSQIPEHSRFAHFDAGGVSRLAELRRAIAHETPLEQARVLVDVVVTSVLLDAGAGAAWRYQEPETGLALGRSEGLAIASLAWVKSGGLSSRGRAFEVDSVGLRAVTTDSLGRAFQVGADNPLVGLEGRVHLLRALGDVLAARPDVFARSLGAQELSSLRLGGLVDALVAQARGGMLPAEAVLLTVLDALGNIWPGRLTLDGFPLGDVWPHPKAGGDGPTAGLLPLHKLSQWLSYSLLEPLRVAGLAIGEIDALTGLAEYRNGGLFLDLGVLALKEPRALVTAHAVGSELVVEWRALTVALLDELAPRVGRELGTALPLASVLEGGTWAAGRELARARRADGAPPLQIESDGTVF